MKTTRLILFILFSLFITVRLLCADDGAMRTWKSDGKQHSINAEYLGEIGQGKIYLLKKDNKVLKVQLNQLSEEDREYVEEQEAPGLNGAGLTKEEYKKFKEQASIRFDEIQEFREDDEFCDIGFDPKGPFYRWILQVRKLKKDVDRRIKGGESEKTNAALLASVISDIETIGSEYADNGGKETSFTQKKTDEIQASLNNLGDNPKGKAENISGSDESGGEPNPFEEGEDEENPFESSDDEDNEELNSPKEGVGPKSQKPRFKDEDTEESSKSEKKKWRVNEPAPLMPDLGSVTGFIDDVTGLVGDNEDAENNIPRVSYEQFDSVDTDMTKDEVFTILGTGKKIRIPFSETVSPGTEVYAWKTENDNFGACEVTFVDDKVENKAWHGKVKKVKMRR